MEKAISLLYQDNAKALDVDCNIYEYRDWILFSDISDQKFNSIKTISLNIYIPEIIILSKYDKLSRKDVKYNRQTVFERDNFKCGYCNMKFLRNKLTIDHIIPKSRGGLTTWKNVITSCFTCNNKKGDRTPQEADMPLLKEPIKPGWYNPLFKVGVKYSCKSWNKFIDNVLIK